MIYLFLACIAISRAIFTISPIYNRFKEDHSEEMSDTNFVLVYGVSVGFKALVNFLAYVGIYHIGMELL